MFVSAPSLHFLPFFPRVIYVKRFQRRVVESLSFVLIYFGSKIFEETKDAYLKVFESIITNEFEIELESKWMEKYISNILFEIYVLIRMKILNQRKYTSHVYAILEITMFLPGAA